MPGADQREYEAKFEVTPDRLSSMNFSTVLPSGYTTQALRTVIQTDTYLDTPAYDLLRHGLALRVRHHGNAFEVGLKSIHAARKSAIQDRMDVSFPLPARAKPLHTSTWPAEIEEQLSPYAVKLEDLIPLVVVRQKRQKADIYPTKSDQPLAEWSLDEVWISTDPIDTNKPGIDAKISFHTHFYELELELLEAGPEARGSTDAGQATKDSFIALIDQVQEQTNLTPIYTSKFVRALEAALAQTHNNATALMPTMELEAAGRLLLHQQLLQIMLDEQGVRNGKKAKYVHDMRVAIRRSRAAIQLCADVFPLDALAFHKKELKRLGRALGTVRDLDVALENLRAFGRSQPEGQRQGIKQLRAELQEERAEAHTALLALLDSKQHRKFIKRLAAFCATPPKETKENDREVATNQFLLLPSQVRHIVPSAILRAFEAVRAYETIFTGDLLPSLEIFHALRIQTKYLRYLLEFIQPLLGEVGEPLSAQLRELQEYLGELNDAHVEQIRLKQWAEQSHDDATLGAAIKARLTQVAARIHELASTAPKHLDDLISQPTREKLALALAHL